MSGVAGGVPDWTDYFERMGTDKAFEMTEALNYCDGEMKNCLAVVDEQAQRIADLERQLLNRDIRLDTANHLAEHLREHIAELERREALLTAMVETLMDWDELNAGSDRGEGWGSVVSALDDLLFSGYPWPTVGAGTPQDGAEG